MGRDPAAMLHRNLLSRHAFAIVVGIVMALTSLAAGNRALADQAAAEPAGEERLLVPQSCDLVEGEGGVVASVVDGDTVVLDSGLEVRLAGIQAPKLPLGRPDFVAWPLADAAKAELERLTLGQAVQLRYGGLRRDRYGRALAQAFILPEAGDEVWLQEAMVRAGFARVYSFADNRQCIGKLIEAERDARRSTLGLWADPYYLIRSATDPSLAERSDSYDLVEGRVLSVGERGPIVYLDFGLSWSTDFTAVMSSEATAALAASGLAPGDLEGRRLRIRGWLEQRGGPSIRVTHPEQLEWLDSDGR